MNSSTFPKISIVTPSYNQGQFLEQTMRSVFDQNYPNLEYIVIDGGSSDESASIIKKYENRLIYWQSKPDKGQTDAINIGLEHCTGDIVGWLNSDDIYLPGALHKVAAAFQDASVDVVHGGRVMIDEKGRTIGWNPAIPFDPQSYGFTVCSETTFWRAELGARVGKLNTDLVFAMDLEFFSRLYQQGKFLTLTDYIGGFRCHADSKTSTLQETCMMEAEREWNKIFNNQNWKIIPQSTPRRMLFDLLRNPRKILLPYLSYRLRRG